jgi:hypothetical protein
MDHRPPCLAIAALLVGTATGAGGATSLESHFALAGGTALAAGHLTAVPVGSPTDLKLDVSLHRPKEEKILKKYQIESGQQMEMIVVSADFAVFSHYRLAHVIDGHGQERIHFPSSGLYHVYVLATPQGFSRQVLRFDLPVGEPSGTPSPASPSTGLEVEAGPYKLSADTLDLMVGHASPILITVTENGKPAANLHHLAGHEAVAVAIDEQTLDYVPVHVAAVGDAPTHGTDQPADGLVSPALGLRLTPPAAGHYRLWLEFTGGRVPYSADFVAAARPPQAE